MVVDRRAARLRPGFERMGVGGGMMMRGRVVWSVAAGLVAALLLVFWRGFFWQHATMIGIAVLALVYSAISTVERLREMHRRR